MLRRLEIKFKSLTMVNGDEYRYGRIVATDTLKPLFPHFLKVQFQDLKQPDMYINPNEVITLIPDSDALKTNQRLDVNTDDPDWSNFFNQPMANPNDTSDPD